MPNKQRAIFLSYQEDDMCDGEPFALFNIVGGDRNGSTVAKSTLEKLGIEIPIYPTFEQWRKQNEK